MKDEITVIQYNVLKSCITERIQETKDRLGFEEKKNTDWKKQVLPSKFIFDKEFFQ